ncbi:hypothetical protein P3T76_000942 [Phytophthora citrophthora]|uniref:Uncharacterized protein n=1 Tax=Phytophthora citrophthora TaxID=4793 RepID=A0AAD9GY65_9STRA|nr:hypothetical protein P3T76_000942 [Phytophthora citrophthora]
MPLSMSCVRHFDISGEYYTVPYIAIDRRYAITLVTWQVAYINERRETPMGFEYQVLGALGPSR